jgi:hypothetical protein
VGLVPHRDGRFAIYSKEIVESERNKRGDVIDHLCGVGTSHEQVRLGSIDFETVRSKPFPSPFMLLKDVFGGFCKYHGVIRIPTC